MLWEIVKQEYQGGYSKRLSYANVLKNRGVNSEICMDMVFAVESGLDLSERKEKM